MCVLACMCACVCAASQTKAAPTEVCKDLTPEADTDWLSGTQPCGKWRRAKKKKKNPLT